MAYLAVELWAMLVTYTLPASATDLTVEVRDGIRRELPTEVGAYVK